MDVDEGRTFKKPDKEGSDPESGLVVTVDQRRVELGSLSFLLRGFESTVHQVSEEFLECEDLRAEGAVRDSNLPEEDHELPPFGEEPVDEAVSGDAELGEVDVELQKYEHLARGHQPYLSSCSTCARAKGKIPARKLVHKRGAYEVASDYGFLGTVRFFVMIVLCTGMIGTFVMDTDMDKNVRSLNNVFREVGLVGKSLEVTLDGEGHLRGLFQRAVRQTNCPVSGVSFVPTPPGRHQTNGKAERAIETIKSGLGANLLFLEERIQRKIPFTSELIRHLLPYVGRTHNMFHLPQGSENSAVDRMKGRSNTRKISTFPFGCRVLAKPTPSTAAHQESPLERLVEVAYLGPWSCTGGGLLGIPTARRQFELEAGSSREVRRFQTCRVVSPCEERCRSGWTD